MSSTESKENQKKPPLIALALGSGVARGFAHIGVLEVLKENNIEPNIICGVSIGALAGACFAMDKVDAFSEWALSLNRLKIFSYLDFKVKNAGLIGGSRLEKLMREHFSHINIEDMPKKFMAVSADLTTGHEVWLRNGDLVTALKASFALPGVFAPVWHQGRFLADGALVNPLPVAPCLAQGALMTIAVDLNGDTIGKAIKPGNHYQTIAGFDALDNGALPETEQKRIKHSGLGLRLFRRQESTPSLFGVMVSALGIMQDRLSRSRLAGDPPDIHIKPKVGHIGLMEFEKAEELIKLGREAAEKALPDILRAYQLFVHSYDH